MIKALKGKKLHDLVRDGSKKLATIAPAAAGNIFYLSTSFKQCLVGGAPAGGAQAPAAAGKAEEKKEEKKEEEADVDMGGLFGDDY